MPRYKLTIEYDGMNYAGWQKQLDQPSVQGSLIDAAHKFSGETVDVVGAGRTDARVHATAQVAHVDFQKDHDPYSVMQGLNFHLFQPNKETPENCIAVNACEKVDDEFSARFSATRRHYIYRIINRKARLGLEKNRAWQVGETLDIDAMLAAAEYLKGHHDFSSFRDSECQAKSPVKTLDRLDITRQGDDIVIQVNARSFLHHQVRIIVGTLALVGKGKWQPEEVKTALEAKDRKKGGPTAPAEGLYLVQVDYN